jgi:hypothetical protein
MATPDSIKVLVSLQNLPEEILDNIACHAMMDALNLRLTCRAIEQKTFHSFTKDIIGTRSVWVNRRSLQSLEDIANNDKLGRHVRRILVMNYEWELETAEGIWGDGEGMDEAETRLFKHFYEQHGDQMYILQSGMFTMTMTQIFSKLPNLECLEVFPSEHSNDFAPYGRLEVRDQLGLSTGLSEEFINAVWFSICQSLIASARMLKTLVAGQDEENILRPECFTSLVRPQKALLAPVLGQLSKLRMGCDIPTEQPQSKIWFQSFSQFLHLCSSVTILSLQFADVAESAYAWDDEEGILSNMETWPTFPKLQVFEMLWFHIHLQDLIAFITRHKDTIKKLYLVEFTLAVQDDWQPLLRQVGELLDLDEVDVSMFEVRHGGIRLIEAKRPNIQQAIEDRLNLGVFCPKCEDLPTDPEDEDYIAGAEIDSDINSLPEDDGDPDFEDID